MEAECWHIKVVNLSIYGTFEYFADIRDMDFGEVVPIYDSAQRSHRVFSVCGREFRPAFVAEKKFQFFCALHQVCCVQ